MVALRIPLLMRRSAYRSRCSKAISWLETRRTDPWKT